MLDYNYNFEVKKNLKMFESCLDDTIIKRYDDQTDIAQDSIKVNYIYGPKQRILQDLRGQPDTVKLPIVAITTTGFNRDDARLKNKLDDIVYKDKDGSYVNIKCIPFNIDVSVTILCKYQEDLDQIVQNFVVHSNPYFIYSLQEPKSKKELRVEVLWDGKIGTQYPTDSDLPPNTPFRITGTANFTIKTWLFKTVLEPISRICVIYDDIIVTDNFYCDYPTLTAYTKENQIDHYSLSGKPILRYVNPYYLRIGETPTIKLQGDGFLNTYAVFVSGSDQVYPNMTTYNPLSAFGDNTEYKGFLINDFYINSPQELTFTLPAPSGIGFVDIFVVNPCGMGQLTVDSNRCSRVENPYPNHMPEHYSWCVDQFPYLNGLVISNELNEVPEIDYTRQIIIPDEESLDKESTIEQIKELMRLADITISDLT